MTTIRLYNTKTRRKEDFVPLDPGNVRMYVCGPTVYDRAHLGNARPVVVFDVLYRLLRHVYGADHVTYVRNFTDVDDKINKRALENVGEGGDVTAEIARLTARTTQWFLDDMGELGALEPSIKDDPDHEKAMPRATAYIPAMIAMIETLIEKGHAYEAEGHVLFAVDSWKEKYGRLSGRSVDDMIAGSRVEVAPYKKNPMDFVLWKPSSDDLPGWDSPWGRGRPGWHIECSAMSYELLGESFDIHGGGNDLMFPHHENEIAQSRCAHPEGDFARYWLHNEMLQVEGKKMAKSLGNFFTVRDLLDQGYPGEVIRFVFLSTHYRKPMDWTEEKARQATGELDFWARSLSTLPELSRLDPELGKCDQQVIEALSDDLNTSLAISRLQQMARDIDDRQKFCQLTEGEQLERLNTFVATAEFLGFAVLDAAEKLRDQPVPKDIEYFELNLVHERIQARKTNDFSKVDRLKAALVEAGVEVRMSKEGVELVPGPNFDPAKLEALREEDLSE